MKQTISVNLNRQVFYLDLDAYETLKKYLEDIKKCFSKESPEVVDDIEARIAEKFGEIIGKSKKAIQLSDVDKIIEEMGSVDDLSEDETETINEKEDSSTVKKKLFRDPDTKIIAGVASGLAWYFGTKSIWIRILFFIVLVSPPTFWIAIVAYVALWLIFPEAKTSLEKLEMQGKPATLGELQTAIEEKTSTVISNVETKTQNLLQKIFSAFGRLIKIFFVWGCRTVGFFTFVSLICAVVAVVVGLVFVYFDPSMPYFDLSFLKAIGSPMLEILFVALLIIILMPLVFMMDVADTLMHWKWLISFKKIIIMMVIWVSATMLFAGVAKLNYPKYGEKLVSSINQIKYINWIDDSNSETIKVQSLSDIDISAVKEVTITSGPVNSVKIYGAKEEIRELDTKYTNGKLTIAGHSSKWFNCQDCGAYTTSVRIEIVSNNLKNIKLDDNMDALFYPVSSSVNINVGDHVGLKIVGKLNQASVTADTYSVVNMLETELSDATLTLRNATAKIWSKKISITGDSQSRLVYKGSPQIIKGAQDKSIHVKYFLSEDSRTKLNSALKDTVVTIAGTKSKIGDLIWSEQVETQSDTDFYNLFTTVKLKADDASIYILWLTEKDGLITLKNSIKINNWESVTDLTVINEKTLKLTGQLYSQEVKTEDLEIYINKIKGVLELKQKVTITPESSSL